MRKLALSRKSSFCSFHAEKRSKSTVIGFHFEKVSEMMGFRLQIFGTMVIGILCSNCLSAMGQQSMLLQTYPCGPDSLTGPLRKLIPQGAFGADFKPACRDHDACYDTPYSNKSTCDKKYLQSMVSACSMSRHPALCRMTAKILYNASRRHGQDAFDSAQRIAIAKLNR
jgi:hypothetical protein